MHTSTEKRYFTNIRSLFPGDIGLFIGLSILMAFGLLVLYSASCGVDSKLIRQSIHVAIACITLLGLTHISPEWYRFATPWLFAFSIILLAIVLISGTTHNGAQRWLHLGFLQFQPAELPRLVLPMMLAWHLEDRELPPTFSECLALLILTSIPTLLIFKQPDLGTAVLTVMSGMTIFLLTGIRAKIIIASLSLGLCLMPLVWTHLHTYQKQRILTFIHPEKDPLGKGYHTIQSKIAIGSGGLLGQGWLKGTQSQLKFLPEGTTDFIFAVCCEEFGLAGASGLIGLYLWISLRSLNISLRAESTFARLLAGSLSVNFLLTAFINIGMVIGILPIVGIPLPMVSYGGTSLIIWAASFGMIMSVHNQNQELHLKNLY